jgi:uncharacterized protein YbaR (Trm112 family)
LEWNIRLIAPKAGRAIPLEEGIVVFLRKEMKDEA